MPDTDLKARALAAEKDHRWDDATQLFLKLAHYHKDQKNFEEAAHFFMRAATSGERCESWRKLGHVWVQCAAALESRTPGAVADMFDPLESTKHFFPTLDRFAWERFHHAEKLGRAYRNAAYHLELGGSNQTAYVQYGKAGDVFREGGMFADASRSYYHGLVSFVERHGELDPKMLDDLETVNKTLIKEDVARYLKRAQLYYRGLAGKLISKGNYGDAARLFAKEAEISRRLAIREHHLGRWLMYTLWKHTSWYGNSSMLWAAWALLLFALVFPTIFQIDGVLNWQEVIREPNWLDYLYFSLATVTTAPDPSFGLSLVGKCISMIETVIGFLMLGSFLSLFAKKIVR